jgi:hypothetical protein
LKLHLGREFETSFERDRSTTDTTVTKNEIEDITSAETILPEVGKIDDNGGGVKFCSNKFLVAVGLNHRNGTDSDS